MRSANGLGRREWLAGLLGGGAWACGRGGAETSGAEEMAAAWADGAEPLAPEAMLDALPEPQAGWTIGYETGRYHHHAEGRVLATTALRVYRRGFDRIRAHWLDHVHIPEPEQFDAAFAGLSARRRVELRFVEEQRSGVLLANVGGRFALRLEGDVSSAEELRAWFAQVRVDGLLGGV